MPDRIDRPLAFIVILVIVMALYALGVLTPVNPWDQAPARW